MSARVILHLPEPAMGKFRTMPTFGIHSAIERLVLERGGQVLIVPQGNKLFRREPLPGDGDLHVVEYGRASGPGYLNAAAAYFDGYFHLDPEGVLAEASTRHLTYNASAVDQAKAEAFMNWLKSRFADQRHSRHRQKKAVMRLPIDSIAVFLQGPMPELRGHAHMSTADMLRAVTQGARGRPVVVKPHPLKPDLGAEQIARAVAEGASLMPMCTTFWRPRPSRSRSIRPPALRAFCTANRRSFSAAPIFTNASKQVQRRADLSRESGFSGR